jgi:hypothetical protein
MRPPETCPNCGAEVPPNARACPACGSDHETGWSERAEAQNLGLPDTEFNYEDFVREEFGEKDSAGRPLPWFWWVVAAALLLSLLAYFL